jgi:hypothetical protein
VVLWRQIIWNFPHSGQQRVHLNRALLRDFFESAAQMLSGPSAEVHVTLADKRPYTSWGVEDQARSAGFLLSRRLNFNAAFFPGYRHVTTEAGEAKDGVHGAGDMENAKTYIFYQPPSHFNGDAERPAEAADPAGAAAPVAAVKRAADELADSDYTSSDGEAVEDGGDGEPTGTVLRHLLAGADDDADAASPERKQAVDPRKAELAAAARKAAAIAAAAEAAAQGEAERAGPAGPAAVPAGRAAVRRRRRKRLAWVLPPLRRRQTWRR